MNYRRSYVLRFDRITNRMYIHNVCRKMTNQFDIGIKIFGGWNDGKHRVYIPCKICNYVYNDLTYLVKKDHPKEYQNYIENKIEYYPKYGVDEIQIDTIGKWHHHHLR